jgi:hypothetical protein
LGFKDLSILGTDSEKRLCFILCYDTIFILTADVAYS